MDDLEVLKSRFEAEMNTTVTEGMKRGYYPTYFLQMIHEHGGVETAKRLLAKQEIQAGLMKLFELGLLADSMEAYVIRDDYKVLFTEEEVKEATRRLKKLRYF